MGVEVYTSVFRFEREGQESFHWFMPEPECKLSSIESNIEPDVVVSGLNGGERLLMTIPTK